MKTKRRLSLLIAIAVITAILLSAAGLYFYIDNHCWGFAREVSAEEAHWRMLIVNTAECWLGSEEKDNSHRPIIDIYNDHPPLARDYIVKYEDEWCSTFASTVAIQCGLTEIIPTECGCEPHIERFADIGAWEEDDSYIPLPGDYIFYCWDGNFEEDCTGLSDHVGIVVGTLGNWIKVIEGNKDESVAYRRIPINDPCIRGFGVPDYAGYAEDNDAPTATDLTAMGLENTSAGLTITAFAQENGLSYEDYPESLIYLLMRNPETETFVLEYPLKSDSETNVDISDYSTETVPLFMQWDQQWGYLKYGDDVAGLTACGPVCLSMAAYYLTGDESMSPDKIIEFAAKNGYCVNGSGSSWKLISEGGKKLGFNVTEIPLDKNRIFRNLEVNNPIICIMGPGDFTTTGHFIVMVGCEGGMIRINDPNSYANSKQLWSYDQIEDQIQNLWVIRN